MRGIHRGPVNSPHKWPVTRKMFRFDDVIMVKEGGVLSLQTPWLTCTLYGYIMTNIPISQIPQNTGTIFHNLQFRTKICTFLPPWMAYFGIWDCYIVGFVGLVYSWFSQTKLSNIGIAPITQNVTKWPENTFNYHHYPFTCIVGLLARNYGIYTEIEAMGLWMIS